MPKKRKTKKTKSKPQRLVRDKHVLVTQREEGELTKLVANIAAEMGTTLKLSHLLRAYIHLLHHAAPQILDQASKTPLQRPPNEDTKAIVAFEASLAHLILIAFKKAPHTL